MMFKKCLSTYTLFLATLCLKLASCSFKIDNSTAFPDLLHFRSADFGYIPYGQIVSGQLLLAPEVDQQGCFLLQEKIYKGKFIVAKIGGCSVLQKAHMAQSNKAALLIVIADHDLIDDVHVLNTGSASDEVRIPVLIFTKTDGDKIETELSQKSNRLNGRCFFPRTAETNGPVSVEYWFDPMDTSNYSFFYKFFTLLQELDKNIKFKVHVALEYSKTDITESDKLNNCVSSGKYCSDDPDGQDTLQGKDVVLLGLAMLCLQQQDQQVMFTKALISFDLVCLVVTNTHTPVECFRQQAIAAGFIDPDFENKCFKETFPGQDVQADNSLLAEEKHIFLKETVQIWPELYVNSRAIRGNINSLQELESSVCGGFEGNIPSACKEYYDSQDDSLGPGTVILLVMLAAGSMFGVLFCVFKLYYHRKFQLAIDGEINSVISKYMAFKDEDNTSQSQ